ncbi:sigma-70 family RNA polymerase sigma factor [candidate division KSB1 bacterium]|nr:sigma-70 family RNA polymerase sigma factor [candidate division KSB1 bacterium]
MPKAKDFSSNLKTKNQTTGDERQIIINCQNGDKQAYGFLVEKYKQRAYFTALGIVGSPDCALDLSQDAFIRAFRAITRLDADKNFFTWYYRILRNLCFNFLRDKSRHARSFSEIDEKKLAKIQDESLDTQKLIEKNEIQAIVWNALYKLEKKEREIIILKDFQDLSYKEIAEILDCPIGTVMSRLYNARKALKAKLRGLYE